MKSHFCGLRYLSRIRTAIYFFLMTAFAALSPENAFALDVDLDFEISSLNYSEPVFIKDNFDDWKTEHFFPGNRIYTKQLVRSGLLVDKNYGVGISAHYYYYLNFSEDTSLWHYLNKNDQLEKNKRLLDIDLHANHSQARGIFLSKRFEWKEILINGRFTYLDLQDITLGSATGIFDPALSAANSSRIVVDYAYTEEKILDRVVPDQSGWGVTTDIYINWSNRSWRLDVALEEIYSSLYWDSVSASKLEGDLSNIERGNEAVLLVREFYSDIRQVLPTHSQFKADYLIDTVWAVGMGYESLDAQDWLSIRASRKFGETWSIDFYAVPKQSIFGLDIKSKYVDVHLAADDMEFDRSHYFRLELGFRAQF